MRAMIATICMLLVVAVSHAQSDSGRIFKPFKVDLSAGFALPLGGEGAKGGFLLALEPKYAIFDKFAVGLRMEIASLARVLTTSTGTEIDGDVTANGSFTLTGDYYFNNNKFRPFIGGGPGYYSLAFVPIENSTIPVDIPTEYKFGFMLRAGFELNHFRFGVEYNGVGDTDLSANNNYFGFKLGGFFGGGRFKK